MTSHEERMKIDPHITAAIPHPLVASFNRRAPFRLQDATLWAFAKRGSHTYGTQRPESDIDYMFVIVPPLRLKFGYEPKQFRKPFEGVEFIEHGFDCVFYTLEKFVHMLFRCSPQSLELLWLRDEDYFYRHPTFNWIVSRRGEFPTRDQVHATFVGMANSKSTTNVMHPIRLLRMCAELLETGRLNVFREDAEELKAIKRGDWEEERLDAELRRVAARVDQTLLKSILPTTTSHELISQVLQSIYMDVYGLRRNA